MKVCAWEHAYAVHQKAHGAGETWELLAGLEEVAQRGMEQLEEHQSPAETSSEPETKEELVDSEYGGGQDTEPLRPSSTGVTLCSPRALPPGSL